MNISSPQKTVTTTWFLLTFLTLTRPCKLLAHWFNPCLHKYSTLPSALRILVKSLISFKSFLFSLGFAWSISISSLPYSISQIISLYIAISLRLSRMGSSNGSSRNPGVLWGDPLVSFHGSQPYSSTKRKVVVAIEHPELASSEPHQQGAFLRLWTFNAVSFRYIGTGISTCSTPFAPKRKLLCTCWVNQRLFPLLANTLDSYSSFDFPVYGV